MCVAPKSSLGGAYITGLSRQKPFHTSQTHKPRLEEIHLVPRWVSVRIEVGRANAARVTRGLRVDCLSAFIEAGMVLVGKEVIQCRISVLAEVATPRNTGGLSYGARHPLVAILSDLRRA
jgi:hypothetical protein